MPDHGFESSWLCVSHFLDIRSRPAVRAIRPWRSIDQLRQQSAHLASGVQKLGPQVGGAVEAETFKKELRETLSPELKERPP